jgi:hypothetical protein
LRHFSAEQKANKKSEIQYIMIDNVYGREKHARRI